MIFLLLISNLYAAEYHVTRASGTVVSYDEQKICLKSYDAKVCLKRLPRLEYLLTGNGPKEVVFDKSDLFEGK